MSYGANTACATVQKQKQDGRRGPGPLLCLMALLYDVSAVAEIFRMIRWADGVFCPHCKKHRTIRYGGYRDDLRRYLCKDCGRTFNDKTGTILHYRHIWMGNWMMMVWMFLAGPLNGISINYIAKSIGCSYKSTYYMIRDIMQKLSNLPEKKISGVSESDEGYIGSASKGVPLANNGEGRTIPSRRGLSKPPGRGTFEKNSPMVTIYFQRATDTLRELTRFAVSRHDKTLVEMVEEHVEPGSTVITDEHPAYKSLEKKGYKHPTVNHSQGEYAAGEHNEIHTNNCECRIGLLKWWLKKHRGVSKWYLELYVKTFGFIHNHRNYSTNGRLIASLAAVLDQYPS